MVYGYLTIVIILTVSCTVDGQPQIDTFKEKPEKCYDTNELNELRCCVFPPFFERAAARECGAMFYHTFTDKKFNVTGFRRDMFGRNNYWRCILKKYKMINEEDILIHEKYYNHLEKWGTLNRDFSSIIATAKLYCMNTYRYRMPVKLDEFFEFQQCIRNYVTVGCPVIIQSKECMDWKDFYEECREFYI